VLDDDWVRQWARDIDDATSTMMATFEADYGYPPGVNGVRWADADDARWHRRSIARSYCRVINGVTSVASRDRELIGGSRSTSPVSTRIRTPHDGSFGR
jgi:hypothetical protein